MEGFKVVGQVPWGALDNVPEQENHDDRKHNDDTEERHEVELLPDPVLPSRCGAVVRPAEVSGGLINLAVAVESEDCKKGSCQDIIQLGGGVPLLT